jgi:hypothetical protein
MSKNDDNPTDFKSKKHTEPYKVGYKHPPLESKFKKGVSGNWAGRPKKEQNLHLLFLKLLHKPVSVKQNGKLCKVSYAELGFTQFLKSAATSGKPQTLALLFKLAEQAEAEVKKLNDDTNVDNFKWGDAQERLYRMLDSPEYSDSNGSENGTEELENE